jgi:sucrose-6-phosphate hydrolase SacC (GH32 family)
MLFVVNFVTKKQIHWLKRPLAPSNFKDQIFSASIVCSDDDTKLSQCSVVISSQSCSTFSYLKCKFFTKKDDVHVTKVRRKDRINEVKTKFARFSFHI